LAIGLLSESFFFKVKVLGGGFGLWLGENIAILSILKRAHLLFITLRPTYILSKHKIVRIREKLQHHRKIRISHGICTTEVWALLTE
jgi:hypothetical protein